MILAVTRWVALFLALAACARTPGASSAATAKARHFAWISCGAYLQCARVHVPLDWNAPKSGSLELAVIRRIGSKPRQRIASLFFNPGGPGVSGVDTVRSEGAYLDSLAGGRFDVVSWDPRGVGASTHVRCFADEKSRAKFWNDLGVPTTREQSAPYLNKTIEFARRCGALSGRLLRHISTLDTARDLDYLRQLVGDRRLTYLGWSYGTFLGVTYRAVFPKRVRAMVLDSIVDPIAYTAGKEAALANTLADTDLVFAKFQSLCQSAGPARCALAGYPPVGVRVDRILARLRRGPIAAPSTPSRKLTYGDTLTAFFTLIRGPQTWPALAKDLAMAEGGDGSALEAVALKIRSPSGYAQLEPAVALGCADGPAREGPHAWPGVIDRLAKVSSIQGLLLGWWLWAPCSSWAVKSTNVYAGPWTATTGSSTLIIGTRFDPNTPFTNARRLAQLIGNGVLLIHDGYGHVSTADPSACIERAERSYLIRLTTPARGATCLSDRAPFDPDFGKPPPSGPLP